MATVRKIVLSGSTGYIGGEVLRQCLSNPTFASIVVLSRRELPDLPPNDKIKVIIMNDFREYNDATLAEITDADACIWALGAFNGTADVEIGYPTAFCEAISKARAQSEHLFTFVYLSGMLAATDQNAALWFAEEPRKAKGLSETKLFGWASEQKQIGQRWETYVARPGFVLPKERSWFASLPLLSGRMVGIQELAAAMIDLTLHGGAEKVLSNYSLVSRGKLASARIWDASEKDGETALSTPESAEQSASIE